MTAADRVYRVVDLFCGCGGLTRGLEKSGRFTTILGVDINAYAIDTFKRNHGGRYGPPETYCGDIHGLATQELWSMLRRRGVTKPGTIDCLVGGPPCEGFSRNKVYVRTKNGSRTDGGVDERAVQPKLYKGAKYWQTAWQAEARRSTVDPESREVQAYNPFFDDARNYLFRAFLRLAKILRPKVILIENVPEILTHRNGEVAQEIVSRLKSMGYVAQVRLLNTANFGVPQFRRRVFFVCLRRDLMAGGDVAFPWPAQTHLSVASEIFGNGTLPGDLGLFVTTQEAIEDLPPATPEGADKLGARGPVSDYALPSNSRFRRFVRSEVATPANNVYRLPSEQVIARVRAMRPGMKPHSLPESLQTKKYYYNAYGRLEWDRPANTITKSFLYPGSGKFAHPEKDRVISYREAARLQSFDDDFTFYANSQEGIAHMIGAAVPPLLGYQFGRALAEFFDTHPPAKRATTVSRGRR